MIKSLQILRGIAALLVVVYHARLVIAIPPDSWFFSVCSMGYAGVNLFFILSGFIMCYTTDDRSNPWKFIGRRLIRIAPLYYLLLLFHAGFHSLTDPQTYLSMFFIPLAPHTPPFLGYATWMVGWTLNYEMFFYLVFFAAMFVGKYRSVVVYGVFVVLHLLFIYFSGGTLSLNPYTELPMVNSAYLYMVLNPMVLLFGVGMIAASVYKRFRDCPAGYNLVVLTMTAVGIICFFKFMYFDGHGVRTSFFCLMLFAAALSVERFIAKSRRWSQAVGPLAYLGTISYSIYLLHLFFLNNLPVPELPVPEWMKMPLVVGVTILASALSYEFIEKRLSGKLKRMLKL